MKVTAVRRLEMREMRARKLAQLALVGGRALLENNEGVRRLAPAFMRQSQRSPPPALPDVARARLRLRPMKCFLRR